MWCMISYYRGFTYTHYIHMYFIVYTEEDEERSPLNVYTCGLICERINTPDDNIRPIWCLLFN